MLPSNGWVRVGAGLQLVATTAMKQVAEDVGRNAARTTGHAADVAFKLSASSPSPIDQSLQENHNNYNDDSNDNNPFLASAPTTSAAPATRASSSTISTTDYSNIANGNNNFSTSLPSPTTTNASSATDILTRNYDRQHQQHEDDKTENALQEKPPSSDSNRDVVGESGSSNSSTSLNDPPPPPTTTTTGFVKSSDYHNNEHRGVATTTDYSRLAEGQAVPSSRMGRALGFASLGVGLAVGTATEFVASRLQGTGSGGNSTAAAAASDIVMNHSNSDRLVASLCRMRGAALKMGQMLSIQDETLLPPELARALEQVRQGADAMPEYQLRQQLVDQLGPGWEDKFESFDLAPFAAASIGQVHRATIRAPATTTPAEADDEEIKDVVVKVQYPGVGKSIESDIRNLAMLVSWTGLAPRGLFIENVMRVGSKELQAECDYTNEAKHQQRMRELVSGDPVLRENNFVVPDCFPALTTQEILVSEHVPGGTIDKVSALHREERNRIARTLLYTTMKELFDWRFMQTDPNWGNFLYDVHTKQTSLIDFGSSLEYPKRFVDGYLRIVWASANRDEKTLMEQSKLMGFLTGNEIDEMVEAHKASGFTIGEPFRTNEPFDFRGSNFSSRMGGHTSVFLKHRLTAPPSEVYTLHRKLMGMFMLCIKIGAIIECRDLLEDVVRNHKFEDGQDPPPL